MSLNKMIDEFNAAYDVPVYETPTILTNVEFAIRDTLLYEEWEETIEAFGDGDLTEFYDGVLDQIYILAGTLRIAGLDVDAGLAEVHRTNMLKAGPDGKVKRREDGKILKPEGWEPPRLAEIIANAKGQN